MTTIYLLMAVLALAEVMEAVALVIQGKRIKEWAGSKVSDTRKRLSDRIDFDEEYYNKRFSGISETIQEMDREMTLMRETLQKHQDSIGDLANGVIPDYEAAKKATEAVNNFHMGVSNVLNFDPFEAASAAKNRGDSE